MADKKRTVKVALYVVVEVDIDQLEACYGQSYTVKEARDDAWNAMFNAATTASYPVADVDKIITRVVSDNR